MSERYRGVKCPKCGAYPGEMCSRWDRIDVREWRSSPQDACHRARIEVWMAAQQAGPDK